MSSRLRRFFAFCRDRLLLRPRTKDLPISLHRPLSVTIRTSPSLEHPFQDYSSITFHDYTIISLYNVITIIIAITIPLYSYVLPYVALLKTFTTPRTWPPGPAAGCRLGTWDGPRSRAPRPPSTARAPDGHTSGGPACQRSPRAPLNLRLHIHKDVYIYMYRTYLR